MDVQLKQLSMIDWDFPSRTSQSLMHDICWYPARFIPAIPSHLIDALSSPGQNICDPFCGSGTTIVEALLLNRKAIGFDINPFAIHIARTKCQIIENPAILKSKSIIQTLKLVQKMAGEAEQSQEPHDTKMKYTKKKSKSDFNDNQQQLFSNSSYANTLDDTKYRSCVKEDQLIDHKEIQKWFHPLTLRQLYFLHSMLNDNYLSDIRQILETIFIATLMPASGHRAGKPYGYFADNVVPKDKLYRNAFQLFFSRLQRLINRCAQLEDVSFGRTHIYKLCVGDARSLDLWDNNEVDCIITSPPYPGAVDYCTAFRLASYFYPQYGHCNEIRHVEIGARWLRKRNSSRQEYFEDMRDVFSCAIRHLAPHGFVALVLPIARTQSPTIKRLVQSLLDADGLREVARVERRILKRYFVRQGGGIRREAIVVFQKG